MTTHPQASSTYPMSREEEIKLVTLYKDCGDASAKEALMAALQHLITPLVTKADKQTPDHLSEKEIRGAAESAASEAIDRFDLSKGARLPTMARFYIRAAVVRAAMDHGHHGRVRGDARTSHAEAVQGRLCDTLKFPEGMSPRAEIIRKEAHDLVQNLFGSQEGSNT